MSLNESKIEDFLNKDRLLDANLTKNLTSTIKIKSTIKVNWRPKSFL